MTFCQEQKINKEIIILQKIRDGYDKYDDYEFKYIDPPDYESGRCPYCHSEECMCCEIGELDERNSIAKKLFTEMKDNHIGFDIESITKYVHTYKLKHSFPMNFNHMRAIVKHIVARTIDNFNEDDFLLDNFTKFCKS